MPTDSVAPIWREIMSACRSLETPTRVAYLGPAGTFSELAALGYFGSSIVKLPCANADEVFHATSAGAADFGVVPVENSSEGVVTRSLDLFLTTPLTIVGETSLYVRHNLLRKSRLARRHRRRLRPSAGARPVPRLAQPPPARTPSAGRSRATPRARASPASTGTLAALASERAASEYGLFVVAPAIQDDAHNRTRFAIVAHPGRSIRRRRPRGTTAPASSSRSRTGRARSTTCSSR